MNKLENFRCGLVTMPLVPTPADSDMVAGVATGTFINSALQFPESMTRNDKIISNKG